ncbi:glycosyltransferase family 4 protein [Salinimicrobium sp. CDJ15-81-2]|nr:glycosyltransferase family 4 protein [Salinimicrobium nanhaiense]
MISMFSNHFFNWTEQLRDSGHEIYWIDVFDSNTYVEKIDFVHQIIGWRNRVDYPGRYWVKNNLPEINHFLNYFNQRELSDFVDQKIQEFKPDVVQSFVLYSAAYPILSIMKNYPQIKWIYSAWGNDLFFRQQQEDELDKIKTSLPNFDYMFADCNRDGQLAVKLGFQGKYLGTFPGGGGYDLDYFHKYCTPIHDRDIILVKGYQGKLGRAIYIIKSIIALKKELSNYRVIIFGCDNELEEMLEGEKGNWPNIEILKKISHEEVMKLMGQAKIYIGNCISDGMPNTLLEAIVMGAFPIQSNPGGATAEIIQHAKNGYLIKNPEDEQEIKFHIQNALTKTGFLEVAVAYNNENVRPKLEREYIKEQVLKKYTIVENELKI